MALCELGFSIDRYGWKQELPTTLSENVTYQIVNTLLRKSADIRSQTGIIFR
jgi:hypothetical protein